MDLERARELILAAQQDVRAQLGVTAADQDEDHETEAEVGDSADPAQALQAQGVDDAVAAALQQKLDALDLALKRVDDGTYGRSVRSGDVIPDARLEADPAAELTVEEQAADEAAAQ